MLKLAAITNQPTLPHGLASRQKRNMRLRANGIEPVPGKDAGIKRRARYLSRVEATVTVKNPQQYLNAPMRMPLITEHHVVVDEDSDSGWREFKVTVDAVGDIHIEAKKTEESFWIGGPQWRQFVRDTNKLIKVSKGA